MIFKVYHFLKNIGFAIIFLFAGYLINPFKLGYIFGLPIIFLLLLKQNFVKQNLDKDFAILLLFSTLYAIFYAFDPVQGNQYIFIYLIFPPMFYLLGKYISSLASNVETLFLTLFVIGAVYSFSGLMSVLQNIAQGGFGQGTRSIPMFWSPGSKGVAATIMGSYFVLNMCIPAILVKRPKTIHPLIIVFMCVIFFFSVLCILRLGTRTQIAISVITLLASLIYIIPKQSLKTNVFMFLFLSLSLGFIFRNVSFDYNSDILSAFADRMGDGANSNVSSGGGRTQRWTKSIEYLFTKPLGWKVEEFGHSHNLWFDTLRVAGIIPFTFLVIFTIKVFLKVKKAAVLNKYHTFFSNQIRIYALAFFLMFMVEPILEGMFPLFVVFCLFSGIVNQYYSAQLKNTEGQQPFGNSNLG